MITAEIKESKVVGTEFPKLMKSVHSDLIVLFRENQSGTVIVGNSLYNVGHVSGIWGVGAFEDFNDELILKNN